MAAFVVLTLSYACNKSSLVGADIFIPDSIDLFFKDDFEVNASSEKVDSILTYNGSVSISSLVVGELKDPFFGSTTAEGFVNVRLNSGNAPNLTYESGGVEKKVILDSVVLVLTYNQDGFYGDTNAIHNIEIGVMDNEYPVEDSIFSTFQPTASRIIGTKSFRPSRDSFQLIELNDTSFVSNQFRMKLDDSWARDMINDTTLVSSSEAFLDYTPGISIKSSTLSSSTIGFDFGAQANGALPPSYIYIYYREEDDLKLYRFPLGGIKHNYYEHDFSGAQIEDFIGDEQKGDSLLFMQGMAGPHIDLELPVLASDELEEFLINKMQLDFFTFENPTAAIRYEPIQDVVLETVDEDGNVQLIEDAIVSFESNQPIYFDGVLKDSDDNGIVRKYTTIISLHAIQEIGSNQPNSRLRLTPRNKAVTPNRSIIYGPGHSQFPMTLKVNYSK